MTKRQRSKDEIVIDWAGESVWATLLAKDIRMRKMIIKGGLADWLVVLSVIRDGEYEVAFVGAPTLLGVLRKLRSELLEETISWRADKYADQ